MGSELEHSRSEAGSFDPAEKRINLTRKAKYLLLLGVAYLLLHELGHTIEEDSISREIKLPGDTNMENQNL